MKVFVLTLSLVAVAFARPDVSELSGSYLPGSSSGSSILSTTYQNHGSDNEFGGQIQHQKHVYFYAAPDDEPPARVRVHVAPSSHRNTKIIFVKAPSYGGLIPEIIAPPSHSEDKTLVYVLVKKPEHPGAVTIPAAHAVKQAKPEVYFIKYKNHHDAEQAVAGGLHEQPVGSSLPDLGDQGSFVRSLQVGQSGGGGDQVVPFDVRFGAAGASGPYKR